MSGYSYANFGNIGNKGYKEWRRLDKDSGDEKHYLQTAEKVLSASVAPALSVFDKTGKIPTQFRLDQALAHAVYLYNYRKIDHYFLHKGVAEFCAKAVKTMTAEYAKALPCDPFTLPVELSDAYPCLLGDIAWSGFAVHFPIKERTQSILVMPNFCWFHAAWVSGIDVGLIHIKNGDPAKNPTDWVSRFVLGFSLYIDAFPDTVVPAKIADVRHLNHYKGTRHMVGQHPAIAEEARGAVSPHWRRGHFRVLDSEKFVNKRFQTVYVRGTFVKGRAFEVLDDAPGVTA